MTKPKNDFKAVCDANEGRTKTHAEIAAELRNDPQCIYHEGDDDGDYHLFFDEHHEHHRSDGRVTRKRAITRR